MLFLLILNPEKDRPDGRACGFFVHSEVAAQRFALPALGRAAERRPTGKMLRRRKMLGIAPESPASGARFVRRCPYLT